MLWRRETGLEAVKMQTLYLDLFSGISGDMFIGALLDLGVDTKAFEQELSKLGLHEYHLHFSRGQKACISGVKFDVHLEGDHEDDHSHSHVHEHHEAHSHIHSTTTAASHSHDHTHVSHSHGHSRNFSDIESLISASSLSNWVKEKSIAVFQRIAAAEGKIHGVPEHKVHFHEVGAVDSIVDIVGSCIALEMLGKPRVLASSVIDGNGWVDCAHGRFPIPAPATLAILAARNIPLSQCSEPHELLTPTGAALLAEFVDTFGPLNEFALEKIGFGLGTRDNKTRPNVLRAILGKPVEEKTSHDWQSDTVAVLETNLDDINSEILGQFVEKALESGALDVFHTPIQMKKNRPGVLLTVICAESDADEFTEVILRETTSFGVRRYSVNRRKLAREFVQVQTTYGEVTVKLGRLDGHLVQAAPEFESCKTVAAESNVPLKDVYAAAIKALK
jgi:uncharacterized protein (TIGR00299 family) protein